MWTAIIFLLISLSLNFIGYWYIKGALTKLLFVSDNLEYMDTSLKAFRANLDAVYEAERFYGDETLEALVLHAREVSNDIDMFSDIVEIFDAEDDIYLQDEPNEEDSGEQATEETA